MHSSSWLIFRTDSNNNNSSNLKLSHPPFSRCRLQLRSCQDWYPVVAVKNQRLSNKIVVVAMLCYHPRVSHSSRLCKWVPPQALLSRPVAITPWQAAVISIVASIRPNCHRRLYWIPTGSANAPIILNSFRSSNHSSTAMDPSCTLTMATTQLWWKAWQAVIARASTGHCNLATALALRIKWCLRATTSLGSSVAAVEFHTTVCISPVCYHLTRTDRQYSGISRDSSSFSRTASQMLASLLWVAVKEA